jgi:hypothetical protein
VFSAESWAANTNPTLIFQPTSTNRTNPSGRYFSFQLYSLSGYTNLANQYVTNFTNPTRRVFSNSQVTFGANFTSPPGVANLGATNGLFGMRFDPTNGVLFGTPTTNFVLEISSGGIQVVSTNRTWAITNFYSNNLVTNSSSTPTNSIPYTNNVTTNPPYRFVFQTSPAINFTNTNMATGTTNGLPSTNANGLSYTYTNISGPGYVTNSTNLVTTGAGALLLRVGISTTNPIWSLPTNDYFVTVTNQSVAGFGFVVGTNTNETQTNLTYLGVTPLVLTNRGTARVTYTLNRPTAGLLYISNGQTYLQALSGTGNLVVTAIRAATATNAETTAVLTSTLSRATNPILMGGVFSNTLTNRVTNPNITSLVLSASASNGNVSFSTADTNLVQITNQTTLRLLLNGTSSIVASVTNANTNNYLPADPVTNTVIVSWPIPAAPVLSGTNRQDGSVGTAYTYVLTATDSNTNAFPVTYTATNLPPGLGFTNGNQISGTPTEPGFYRILLTASNEGGQAAGILTSSIAPASVFMVTNPWTYWVALGSGTNTNGTYTITSLPVGMGTNTTNLPGIVQPVLLLTNANTNPNSGNWFAGQTNLNVVFSNSQTNLSLSIPLNVLPVPPVISVTSAVIGTPGVPLMISATVTPPGLTNIYGYPLTFRSTNLPSGVILNSTSGVISGKPIYAGSTFASIWASNVVGTSATSNVGFDIQARAGVSVQLSLAFTNAIGTYSVPDLLPGLILSPSSGLVSGSPQAVGTFNLTVNFVPAGTATTHSTNRTLTVLPPAPIPRVPASLVTARVGQPFHFQPWVTGPGWGWAGADTLTGTTISTNWTNQILVGTSTVVLASNSNGVIRPTTNGLTFTNNASYNELYLFWRSNLPSSWPWQAFLRLRIPGSLTNADGYAYPVLGAIRARTAYPTNYLDDYADGGLLAESTNGVFPTSYFYSPNATNSDFLDTVGTNEVAIRFRFDTNGQTLTIAANTNLATHGYVGLTTNTNLAVDWSFSNAASAFRLALGGNFSNQAVASNQILLRSFAVLPQGVGFYTSTNLPGGLVCDPETGTIYGTPTNAFSGLIYLYATNAQGTNFTGFRLRVIP